MTLTRPTEADVVGMALFICEDLGGYIWHSEPTYLQNMYRLNARRILNEHYNKNYHELESIRTIDNSTD